MWINELGGKWGLPKIAFVLQMRIWQSRSMYTQRKYLNKYEPTYRLPTATRMHTHLHTHAHARACSLAQTLDFQLLFSVSLSTRSGGQPLPSDTTYKPVPCGSDGCVNVRYHYYCDLTLLLMTNHYLWKALQAHHIVFQVTTKPLSGCPRTRERLLCMDTYKSQVTHVCVF
jgi:hypothetical protein